MSINSYTIIFPAEILPATPFPEAAEAGVAQGPSSAELDEIAELRRIVEEIVSPEPMSYTST